MHLASPLVQCSQTVYGIVASTASDERVYNKEVMRMRSLTTRPLLLGGVYALVALLVVACGGGSGGSSAVSGGTGSVAIAMTDGAAEDFDEINVTVVKIELLSDSGRVTIYEGDKTFNLLDLADKAELFAIRDGVPAGRYSKIRLTLTKIELVKKDADGNTWIMKGFELGLRPKHSYEEFVADAAEMFEHLPAGWKVRVEVLERDLTETPENGIATIMADEHFNVYDKTGPGMSDFTP